jgi:YHS domain-containing protein
MKAFVIAAMLCVGVAGWMNVSHAASPATTQKAQPVNKKCPVGGHDVDPKGQTIEYKGKVIGFCCDDCIADFKKDPEKYMKDLK